jgi:hypothetical protein
MPTKQASSHRTTAATRREIQGSRESTKALATRFHINPKTVQKWRTRTNVNDAPMGPRFPHSTTLTPEEEFIVAQFRRDTLLALDDCLYVLQAKIPHLTRSSLHRCLRRRGVSLLPGSVKHRWEKDCAATELGYFFFSINEVETGEGTFYAYGARERVSQFAYGRVYETSTPQVAVEFLRSVSDAVTCKIRTILTYQEPPFCPVEQSDSRQAPARSQDLFGLACVEADIQHGVMHTGYPTHADKHACRPNSSHYHFQTRHDLEQYYQDFIAQSNFARRLKRLYGRTPYEYFRMAEKLGTQPSILVRSGEDVA